jgi:hypothetical protein
MTVTIGDIDVEIAPSPSQHQPAAATNASEQPDIRKTMKLLAERARRLKAY